MAAATSYAPISVSGGSHLRSPFLGGGKPTPTTVSVRPNRSPASRSLTITACCNDGDKHDAGDGDKHDAGDDLQQESAKVKEEILALFKSVRQRLQAAGGDNGEQSTWKPLQELLSRQENARDEESTWDLLEMIIRLENKRDKESTISRLVDDFIQSVKVIDANNKESTIQRLVDDFIQSLNVIDANNKERIIRTVAQFIKANKKRHFRRKHMPLLGKHTPTPDPDDVMPLFSNWTVPDEDTPTPETANGWTFPSEYTPTPDPAVMPFPDDDVGGH